MTKKEFFKTMHKARMRELPLLDAPLKPSTDFSLDSISSHSF